MQSMLFFTMVNNLHSTDVVFSSAGFTLNDFSVLAYCARQFLKGMPETFFVDKRFEGLFNTQLYVDKLDIHYVEKKKIASYKHSEEWHINKVKQLNKAGFQIPTMKTGHRMPLVPKVFFHQEHMINIINSLMDLLEDGKLYMPISGMTPVSEVGEDAEEKKRNGMLKSIPFEQLCLVVKGMQAGSKIPLVPVSMQYPPPGKSMTYIENTMKSLSQEFQLLNPIQTLNVDWGNNFLYQVLAVKAIELHNQELGYKTPFICNPATGGHLLLEVIGLKGLFGVVAPVNSQKHPYWQEIGQVTEDVISISLGGEGGEWDTTTTHILEHMLKFKSRGRVE